MDYMVDVQTVEQNEEQVSVTGTVNGRQVSAIMLARLVPVGPTKRNQYYAKKLVESFKGVAAAPAHAGMIRVTEA